LKPAIAALAEARMKAGTKQDPVPNSAQGKQKIYEMWMACATQEEIAAAVGLPQQTMRSSYASIHNREP